uniref:PHD finger protein rhinoceros n=1 Tax=Ornithodoros turicata TaxID=34597 RepID=A0A2R5LP54_9ACAR
MPKIYNVSHGKNKPAELFRKDLISAMKMADSDPLDQSEYWPIADSWKPEWERGVQVPVNPELVPLASVKPLKEKKKKARSGDFKLPVGRYLRLSHDTFFSNELHVLSNVTAQAEKMCRYDLDSLDVQWLTHFNEERHIYGLPPVPEVQMEMIMEDLETQCYENLQREIKTEQGLGIEYDEDVICDVCRSPDSEEGNEMVFCDACDLCVHQACYGITSIPEGSWLCRTCALGIRPSCLLCPNTGGAMKSTRSGQKWAHVSCALWIPEVSIGCVEKMEPITKISQIPASRWMLTCCLCREKSGACIQCSIKTCKRAYHVTCAFENSLEMKAIIDENPEEGVKLRSFCSKHSRKKDAHASSDSEGECRAQRRENHPGRREIEMTSEEKDGVRLAKIQAIEAEFYKHVNTKDTVDTLSIDPVVVDFVFNYWKLKRKANHDKPLLTPRHEETDRLDKLQENSLYSRMKMFIHLRQDLERVRNLCYMVTRREKISKSFLKMRREVFEQQVKIMSDKSASQLSETDAQAVRLAGQTDHIYDRLNSEEPHASRPSAKLIVSALEGQDVGDLFGQSKPSKKSATPSRLPNPYAKHYINGLRSRRSSAWNGESTDDTSKDASVSGTDEMSTPQSRANGSVNKALERMSSFAVRCGSDGDVAMFAEDSSVDSQDVVVDVVGEEKAESEEERSFSVRRRLRNKLMLRAEERRQEEMAEGPSDTSKNGGSKNERAAAEEVKVETQDRSPGKRSGSRNERAAPEATKVEAEEAEAMKLKKDSCPKVPADHAEVASPRMTRSSTQKQQHAQEGLLERDNSGPAPETSEEADENAPKFDGLQSAADPSCNAVVPQVVTSPKVSSPLASYKIPKKSRAPNGVVEDKRGSSPVSPLHEVLPHRYSAAGGYGRARRVPWQRSHNSNFQRRTVLTPHSGEMRKWRKDVNCDAATLDSTQQWKADADFTTAPAWSTKENGSRYSMRFRPKYGKES